MARREMLNCPNCGAPIETEKCPYCGTVFWDFSAIDTKDINYLKIKHNGRVFICKAFLVEQQITTTHRQEEFYTDNMPFFAKMRADVELQLNFHVVPDHDGILYREVKTNG